MSYEAPTKELPLDRSAHVSDESPQPRGKAKTPRANAAAQQSAEVRRFIGLGGGRVDSRPTLSAQRQGVEVVQALGDVGGADAAGLAATGVTGNGSGLPHLARIQASFGAHDLSQVKAFVGGPARAASDQMGARAYATGDRVAFREQPDLHTAAHEAAHVVQQRGGVQLKGKVGQPGDQYERHADRVADRVVQGKDASDLLAEPMRTAPVVQMETTPKSPGPSPKQSTWEFTARAELGKAKTRFKMVKTNLKDVEPLLENSIKTSALDKTGNKKVHDSLHRYEDTLKVNPVMQAVDIALTVTSLTGAVVGTVRAAKLLLKNMREIRRLMPDPSQGTTLGLKEEVKNLAPPTVKDGSELIQRGLNTSKSSPEAGLRDLLAVMAQTRKQFTTSVSTWCKAATALHIRYLGDHFELGLEHVQDALKAIGQGRAANEIWPKASEVETTLDALLVSIKETSTQIGDLVTRYQGFKRGDGQSMLPGSQNRSVSELVLGWSKDPSMAARLRRVIVTHRNAVKTVNFTGTTQWFNNGSGLENCHVYSTDVVKAKGYLNVVDPELYKKVADIKGAAKDGQSWELTAEEARALSALPDIQKHNDPQVVFFQLKSTQKGSIEKAKPDAFESWEKTPQFQQFWRTHLRAPPSLRNPSWPEIFRVPNQIPEVTTTSETEQRINNLHLGGR